MTERGWKERLEVRKRRVEEKGVEQTVDPKDGVVVQCRNNLFSFLYTRMQHVSAIEEHKVVAIQIVYKYIFFL